MLESEVEGFPEGCRVVRIPSVEDGRGALAFAEVGRVIPFSVERVFWIYDVPEDACRGGHAHWTCHEFVVPVCGAFTVVLDDGVVRSELRMARRDEGVVIPAGVWCELRDFAPGTVLLVMASQSYQPSSTNRHTSNPDENIQHVPPLPSWQETHPSSPPNHDDPLLALHHHRSTTNSRKNGQHDSP